MKNLILMRHGKAEKSAESGEDFDRDLVTRGRDETLAVAQALKAYGLMPDLAIVSSACRTLATFAQVKAVFGEIKALISDDFYNADSNILRHAIEASEDEGQCLLVIGHNPGIQYLAADYLYEGASGLDIQERIRSHYPTATATVFDVDVAGRPIFSGLYRPKDLIGPEDEGPA